MAALTFTGGGLTLANFAGQLITSAATGGGVQITLLKGVGDARNDFNGDGFSDKADVSGVSAFHPLRTLDWHDTFADAMRIRIPRALILLAPLAVGVSAPASAASCGAPLQNWSLINEVPGTSAVQPVNFVFIDAQSRLHWNGNVATESQVREYLGLIAGFQKQSAFPENLTVLGSDPNAACAAVRRMRQMFNDVLGCGHGSCAELGG